MLDLITVGDVKLDTFVVIDSASVHCELKNTECKICVNYGEKIPVAAFVTQIAGSAPNVAVALAKMHFTTSVLSRMGDDIVYDNALRFLEENKVSSKLIKPKKHMRSSAAVVLNYKGESTQLVDFAPHEYVLPAKLPQTKFLHVCELGDGYEKMYTEVTAKANGGLRVSLNPGAVQIRERKQELFELIAVCEVLFVNLVEAKAILQKPDDSIHVLTAGLKALGPKYVVITDGARGAYAYDGAQLDLAPAFPGTMVEATGAGDAFASGFLGALLKGKEHAEALRWGSVNAASVIEQVGPTAGLLSHTEIMRRIKEHPAYQSREM